MIICNSRKFVFIHTPKNAGGAIARAIRPHLRIQDVDLSVPIRQGGKPIRDHYEKSFGINKHSTPAEVRKLISDNDYVYFGMSRNPYARIWSAYKFTLRVLKNHPLWFIRKTPTFEQFLENPTRYRANLVLRPQTDWLESVDVVGRLENLETDLGSFLSSKGINDFEIGFFNVSAEPLQWKSMSEFAKQHIREVYRCDFESLGYSTDFDAEINSRAG